MSQGIGQGLSSFACTEFHQDGQASQILNALLYSQQLPCARRSAMRNLLILNSISTIPSPGAFDAVFLADVLHSLG